MSLFVAKDKIVPSPQTNNRISKEIIRDTIALCEQGFFLPLEQNQIPVVVPAFDHGSWRLSARPGCFCEVLRLRCASLRKTMWRRFELKVGRAMASLMRWMQIQNWSTTGAAALQMFTRRFGFDREDCKEKTMRFSHAIVPCFATFAFFAVYILRALCLKTAGLRHAQRQLALARGDVEEDGDVEEIFEDGFVCGRGDVRGVGGVDVVPDDAGAL